MLAEYKKKRLICKPLSFLSFAEREGFFLHFVSKATSSMTNPRRVLIPLRRLSRFFNKKRDLFASLFPLSFAEREGFFLHFVSKATSLMTNPRRVLIPLRRLSRFFNKKRDLFASLFPFYHLRKERDSNPRYSYPYTAFRVRPDRPLRHLSECGCKGSVFFADNQKKSIFFALYVAFFLRMSKKVHFTSFYVLRN